METSNKDFGEILKKGEALFLSTFKKELESEHMGDYAVIDVDSKKYIIDSNKIQAIKKAQGEFGNKLFYIVQVGYLDEPTVNFRERKNVAWIF